MDAPRREGQTWAEWVHAGANTATNAISWLADAYVGVKAETLAEELTAPIVARREEEQRIRDINNGVRRG